MIISNVAINNRTTVGTLVAVIAIMGAFSYLTIPRENEPDVPIPYIVVTTAYEGVSPEDVESSVTIKIEKELAGLKGLKEMQSTSAEGVSIIVLEFLPEISTDDAMQYVRDKVDLAKAEIPEGTEEPVIKEISFSDFPIVMVNLSGDISPVRLKAIADELEDLIESVPGVLSCDVLGAMEREIRLEIDQDKVAAYGLTIPEILSLIPSENVNISAGGLEMSDTKLNVRVPAEFVEPSEVNDLLIAVREGRSIYLTDVARVSDTFKDRTQFSRLNGQETITLSVQKRAGENIIFIAEAVKEILRQAKESVPAAVRFDITLDKSEDTRLMVSDLENNMLSGLILVALVLLAFLGWRVSLIVGFAIPMSMLAAVTIIYAMGYTLNMVVLFSLIMALGMLVDNAIVIVENIYRHYQISGNRIEAAKSGTAEVAWPVIGSTATTLAAFAPMMFWPGLMGGFMKYLPITLIITLSCSLFVALVINPTLGSLFVKSPKKSGSSESRIIVAYRKALTVAMENRWATQVFVVLLLVGLGILYGKKGHGVELLPEFDPRRAMINVRCPQGTHITETDRIARMIEDRVSPYGKYIEHVVTNVGSGSGGDPMGGGGGGGGDHLATITLSFFDFVERKRPSADVVADIRADLADIAGAEIKVEKEKEGPPTGAPVTVRIIGKDFSTLEEISEQARKAIANVPGLVNLRSDHEAARPELAFNVDRRRAMLLGVNTAIVGNFLKTAVFGSEVGKYRQYNDEYDITVRLPLSQRESVDNLLRLCIPNSQGHAVPLSSLGDFSYVGGYGTIRRIDQKRVITLSADAEGRLSTAVLADAQKILAGLEMPSDYVLEYAGEKEEQVKAEDFLKKAFAVAMMLIVLILVAQFNSLSVPIMIIGTVVLSLIGVLSGLLICQMPFGVIMTGIGVISLAGVVVNNAIVLLDYTRILQNRGMELVPAAIEAGATRLRPVLLTATTTILGLIPMAVGVSIDFHNLSFSTRSETGQWWSSMAIAVIFGLAFATLLTLVVLPTMYVSFVRFTWWLVPSWSGVVDVRSSEGELGKSIQPH